jgi:hypothetical protein
MIVEVHVIALSYQILGWSIINCLTKNMKYLLHIHSTSEYSPKAIQNVRIEDQLNKILLDLT